MSRRANARRVIHPNDDFQIIGVEHTVLMIGVKPQKRKCRVLHRRRSLRGEGGIDRWREDFGDVAFEPECDAGVVVISGAAVDDDIGHTALGGQQRDGGSGVDGERGAESYHEIGFECGLLCAPDLAGIKLLAKADGGGLEEAAAMADGRFAVGAKVFEVRRGIGEFVAALAFDFGIGTVEFDEAFP